ncbi:hypothetical protein [Zhongshania sp.]|uniref:DoxX family protein n=1 Tax=Zhongshania sp. TaxID=1971902 RepID=UPI0035694D4B
MSLYKKLGLGFVFLWFFLGGLGHFLAADFFANIMPPYLPWHYPIVYISGIFELFGAVGILLPRWRQLAGNCLFVLTIAVTPANIHMFLNPEQFPDTTPTFLTIRLVVQVFLLACIWWSTREISGQNPQR